MKIYMYLAIVLLSAHSILAESMNNQSEKTVYHIDNQADFDAYASDVFAPGDQILFKRGAIFSGMFAPKGSGEPGKPLSNRPRGTPAWIDSAHSRMDGFYGLSIGSPLYLYRLSLS